MSGTYDLFTVSAVLQLPDEFKLAGAVLGNHVQQLSYAAGPVEARLTPLSHGQVQGFLADLPDRTIAIVGKRTSARLPASAVLVGVGMARSRCSERPSSRMPFRSRTPTPAWS